MEIYVLCLAFQTELDGHSADLVIFIPQSGKITPSTPILFIHPAIGVAGLYYHRFAQKLVQRNGWIVVVQEMRGQGTSNWRAGPAKNWGYWTIISTDFDAQLSIVSARWPNNPIFVGGHSASAVLWALWLAKQTFEKSSSLANIKGHLAFTTGDADWKHYPSRNIYWFARMTQVIIHLLGWLPGTRIGFGADTEAKDFMLDWGYNILYGGWDQIKDCTVPRITSSLKQVNLPALYISLAEDALLPTSCTELLARHYGPEKVTHIKLRHKEVPSLKDLPVQQIHFKIMRSDEIFPYIESFVSTVLANPSSSTLPSLAKL